MLELYLIIQQATNRDILFLESNKQVGQDYQLVETIDGSYFACEMEDNWFWDCGSYDLDLEFWILYK